MGKGVGGISLLLTLSILKDLVIQWGACTPSHVLWEPSDLRDTQGQVPIRGFPRITLTWSGMAVSQSWKRGKQ